MEIKFHASGTQRRFKRERISFPLLLVSSSSFISSFRVIVCPLLRTRNGRGMFRRQHLQKSTSSLWQSLSLSTFRDDFAAVRQPEILTDILGILFSRRSKATGWRFKTDTRVRTLRKVRFPLLKFYQKYKVGIVSELCELAAFLCGNFTFSTVNVLT